MTDGARWRGRTVFLTGATGLVGSWTARLLLEQGARVVALVRDLDPRCELARSGDLQRVTVVNGELENYALLERALGDHEIDTVIHLGAQTIVGTANHSPMGTFESNIRGTYNLLEACRVHRNRVARIAVASSDKAYGDQPILPYDETMPVAGRHPYDVSKSCTDLIARAYYETYRLPIVVARCGNIFGGGDLNWSRIVPGTIRSLLRDEDIVLRGDGQHIRDYIYVKDVAHAYALIADRAGESGVSGEAFNFSTEIPLSVLDMVRAIQDAHGPSRSELRIENRATGEIRHQHLSAAKARASFAWSPTFGLDDALRETIAWYRDYFEGSALSA
ncbi:MAG: NAD-dependent epimerase/dehydratase family protein [Chloroflexota bacterium]|nr:MAG: NAD-dependent epimerase/dehydratase family protein [Chloroflexota bacterium]